MAKVSFTVTFALGAALVAGAAVAQGTFVTIGTGGVTGVYYPAGSAICGLVNKGRGEHGVACSVEATSGSEYNLDNIRSGKLDMGVAQSDWQHHAYNGTSKFKAKGPHEALRAVLALHAEPFTVVARADAGIKTLEDLKTKRVNIGNPGSGQRGTMEVVMHALGWTVDDFELVSELKSGAQSKALCADEIDAMVFTVGHPNGSIKEATTTCDAVLVEVSGPAIDKLVEDNDYYRYATIPGGMYRGTENDVATFGVGATVVSSTKTPDEVVYAIVKAVFENLADFKKLHPAFTDLKDGEMVQDGLSAPLHSGALKYYKEAGMM